MGSEPRPFVRAEAFERVLHLETEQGRGTAFTIEHAGNEWLVTARHLLPDEPAPLVTLSSRFLGRVSLRLGFLPALGPAADVAVAHLQDALTPVMSLPASSSGLQWSQQVYFLGYPYGMATQLSDDEHDRIPFVKGAIVSASTKVGGIQIWFLDGYGNPGFSGGPVVANTAELETMQVVGVVAGNRADNRPVLVADRPIENAIVRENTGILMATDIGHVIDLISG